MTGPIGIFDSGYGGLTIMKAIVNDLPQYDCIYLGDNARAPYGDRSFEAVYQYTRQSVQWLFSKGCRLVIIACNTASAKALRTIQQQDLPSADPGLRVLGVIRPTSEVIGNLSKTGHVGILGTKGTVLSESYLLEVQKFFPGLIVTQEACPIWATLVENNECDSPGTHFFVEKHIRHLLSQDPAIDTLLLACTHYPLLMPVIQKYVPSGLSVIEQGPIVSASLVDYLKRHPEMEIMCSKGGHLRYFSTGDPADFDLHATQFFGQPVKSQHIDLQ
jgi:glutamate racemase